MKAFRQLLLGYSMVSAAFLVYSFGFVDKNLKLSTNPYYRFIHNPLEFFVFEKRGYAGGLYVIFLLVYWVLYYLLLRYINQRQISISEVKKLLIIVSVFFLFTFPAFSYDIFNYALTAKVAYIHKENPWVVRPIDILREPALAYTRAANKVALYGPTWILLTFLPNTLSGGNVWMTIILFKLLVLVFYYVFIYLLWRTIKNIWNIAFFAFNPLVLITILNEGHNDIVMMVIASISILILTRQITIKHDTFTGFFLFILSVFVKGATVILFPLYVLRRREPLKIWKIAYWLMFIVFFVSPLREEMYPWYFVWCVCCLVFLPKSERFMYGFSWVFCFGLLLRNTPYIVTRQYEGFNQMVRTGITWIPVVIFLMYSLWRKRNQKAILNR